MSRKIIIDRTFDRLRGQVKRHNVKLVVDVVFEEMVEALLEGHTLNLYGLGKFQMRERSARKARNPYSGEEMSVPPRKYIKVKISAGLKKRLREMSCE